MASDTESEGPAGGRSVMDWVVIVGLSAVLVAAGFWIGLRLTGPQVTETGIGRVSIEVTTSPGSGITAFIPVADWGLQVDAFKSLFGLEAELRTLDRAALGQITNGNSTLINDVETELSDAATRSVVKALGIGLLTTLVILAIATALLRGLDPRWGLLAVGGGLSVLMIVFSVGLARVTFDREAFASPTYFASGDELTRILVVAQDPRARTRFGAEFGSILRGISVVLSNEDPIATERRTIYQASDFHGNALVVDPVAEAVGDTPLMLIGDFGQRSLGPEIGLIAPRVAALGKRAVAVSGNHDSIALMKRMAYEGVTVLGKNGKLEVDGSYVGDPIELVEGLKVAGYPDPLEWQEPLDSPDRPITFKDFDDTDAARAAALADIVEWFDGLEEQPDVLLLHQNELAEGLAEVLYERGYDDDLAILTGHNHRQQIDRFGSIVVVNSGSVGASGFLGVGRDSVGLARLEFGKDLPQLHAVDLMSIEPISGQAQASRIVIAAMCPDQDRCTVSPAKAMVVTPEELAEAGEGG